MASSWCVRTREGRACEGSDHTCAAARAGRHGVAGAVRRCLRRRASRRGRICTRSATSSSSTRRTTRSTTSTAAGRASTASRNADRRAHDAGRPGRHPVQVPPAERRQPHLAAAAGHVHGTTPRPRSRATSRTSRSPSTTTSAERHHLPGARRVRAERRAQGSGLPGGCTRDLVHRFYQEQYQIDGGKQDRYVTGGRGRPAMGRYDTRTCPSTSTCTGTAHPNYVIADNFFQAAFGGSFLNHQWLVAAATPISRTPATTDRRTTCTRWSTPTGCRPTTRCTRRPGRQGRGADRAVRLAASRADWPAATTPSTRSSRPTSRTRRAPPRRAGCRRSSAPRSVTA